MAIITLATDFGTQDGYVAAMKGVIARLAPDARVVDIAHDIPRHDVAHAAWVIATSALEFPPGTVHVVVVDPGVGGARADVIVRSRGHLFVGPDNGTFAYVAPVPVKPPSPYDRKPAAAATPGEPDGCWTIANPPFRAAAVSPTFHGRDVFAPAAAALAGGAAPSSAGAVHKLAGALVWPATATDDEGVIVHIDRFGNLISNLRPGQGMRHVIVRGMKIDLKKTYADAGAGDVLAYVGSAGTIEVAVSGGDAARILELARGTPIGLAP
jgi:S-adenosylmethionine hydrolase